MDRAVTRRDIAMVRGIVMVLTAFLSSFAATVVWGPIVGISAGVLSGTVVAWITR